MHDGFTRTLNDPRGTAHVRKNRMKRQVSVLSTKEGFGDGKEFRWSGIRSTVGRPVGAHTEAGMM